MTEPESKNPREYMAVFSTYGHKITFSPEPGFMICLGRHPKYLKIIRFFFLREECLGMIEEAYCTSQSYDSHYLVTYEK